ncbi:camp-dependent protein kinase [Phaffia rhodozyma]|uniref:non-specific serine/threonine protein kinase n=1 Tax=Phaffia rhodozyma TaxID=264483 RepID=A0A0F7SIS0_PHARH|nr:camp-dependent protein kinase [Phaffia rhodozyma]
MGASCCKPDVIDYDGETNLFHFYLLRSVGKGAFGKVRVVQHKQTKQLLALKYINKAKCCKMKAVANVIQERRLLEEIDHPFVVNLRYAFQDDEHCFFVLDLMLGGDLRFHLDRLGSLPEEAVKFIVSEIVLALDYLHSIRIVHRDLKPDNLLLDERGHVHLTDFNIAVHFTPSTAPNAKRLMGVAGSMAYMAPEVLNRKGYACQIDWWSLGVIVYELYFGRRPFRGKTNSALTESIASDRLVWPDDGETKIGKDGKEFISSLLERDPMKRLGWKADGTGLTDIKRHPWLRSIDWSAVESKQAVPVFVPDSKKANFDATHELEELLLEENPLKARKRKPNQDVSLLSTDMRLMEEHFRLYDYRRMSRKSYYHPSTPPPPTFSVANPANNASSLLTVPASSTSITTLTKLIPLGPIAQAGSTERPKPERANSSVSACHLVSRTGLRVESRIANGGGKLIGQGEQEGGFELDPLNQRK